MSVKQILATEQKTRERHQEELDAAADAVMEPQQRLERAQFRKQQNDTKLARKYHITGDDTIDVFGEITRGKRK